MGRWIRSAYTYMGSVAAGGIIVCKANKVKHIPPCQSLSARASRICSGLIVTLRLGSIFAENGTIPTPHEERRISCSSGELRPQRSHWRKEGCTDRMFPGNSESQLWTGNLGCPNASYKEIGWRLKGALNPRQVGLSTMQGCFRAHRPPHSV